MVYSAQAILTVYAVVVTKLFNICSTEFCFLWSKNFQQLAVIRQFVRDLKYFRLKVIGVPITGAEDGLALSSRNGYLRC